MRLWRCSVWFMLALAVWGERPGLAEEAWRLQELVPGVHAALQPPELRFNDSNSVLIIGKDEVVVVDAQATLERA